MALTSVEWTDETTVSRSAEQVLQPIQRLYDSIARHPDVVAIAHASGDITYADLGRHVSVLASAFQERDPAPGSRVAICAGNTVEHLIALLATYAAGKVWVPLSPRYTMSERERMITSTCPSIVVDATSIAALIASSPGARTVHVERSLEDAQIIKFSGGSTGVPKPVVQSLRCLNAQADGIRDFFAFTSDDVNLIVAPLTHGASCFVLPILEVGGRHVMLDDTKPEAIFDAIASHGVTTIYAPPTLLYAMIDHPLAARTDFTSLRHVIYSAAPMPPQRIRDAQRVLGPVIETAYGQVEAPQIVAAMRAHELLLEENLASVGRPSSVASVKIMEGSGEILVSGPLLMNGYLDREEDTSRALIDGWLHTGDVGVLDDRGYLFIRGRLREVINTGGFKVFPGEIEAALVRHAAVAECAVFGAEDAKWGEAVHAAVVLEPGIGITDDELIAWVKAELGSVKAPKRIWRVEQLERNAAGKVSRSAVRASIIEQA